MKISFLKAPIGGIIGLEMITFVEPLGMECVAGGLELEGHTCQIVDMRIDGIKHGLAKMRAFAPDIVGLQCNFTTERFRALRLAKMVRTELPDVLVVIGGHDASRDPSWFLKPAIDVVVVGDGEEVMTPLVAAWRKKRDLSNVPGLLINTPSGPIDTGHAPARGNIDNLPMPGAPSHQGVRLGVLHQLPPPAGAARNRARLSVQMQLLLGLEVSREHVPREVARPRRQRNRADRSAEHLHHRRHFLDEREARPRARQGASPPRASRSTTRSRPAATSSASSPSSIEQWKDCGRMTVFLGLEKIDDAGLKSVNKKNTADNNNRAIKILQDLDIGYTPNFIVDPSWERPDFEKLKQWVDATGAYNSGFSVLTPLPGTDLWDATQDTINTRDWELFDIAHTVLPTKLPLDEFYREYAGLWKHANDVRYQVNGRMKTHLGLIAALATRRVTFTAIRKGMRMGNVLSDPATFLRAHGESEARLAEAASLVQ